MKIEHCFLFQAHPNVCCPASSAQSERDFSHTGLIITARRSLLFSQEICVCIRIYCFSPSCRILVRLFFSLLKYLYFLSIRILCSTQTFLWRNKCSGYSRACCGLRAGPRAGPRAKFIITAGCGLDLLK